MLNFKIFYFFFEVYFEPGDPKIQKNFLKNICNGAHFFDKIAGQMSATFPKMHPQGFCSNLLLPIKISRSFRKVLSQETFQWRVSSIARFQNVHSGEHYLFSGGDQGLRKPKALIISSGSPIVLKQQNIHVSLNCNIQ